MPEQPQLPEDLKQRLLAAGVQDEASLRDALIADAELRQAYENWLVRSTLRALAETPDVAALAELVERSPILLEPAMLKAIEQAVRQALYVGDDDSAEALIQRAEALKAIQARRQTQAQPPSALAQALIEFVQAPDEDAARTVFARHRDLLAGEGAEELLGKRFEPEDETSQRHLRARRGLLRLLRMAED